MSTRRILLDGYVTGILGQKDATCRIDTPIFQRAIDTAGSRYPGLNISLDGAGLVVLADLKTTAVRTALTGTSAFLDTFILCPGIHRQQSAPELSGGEYPACAAMTTGYVFRVENPATVLYLQKVGLTGQLTSVSVTKTRKLESRPFGFLAALFNLENAAPVPALAYLTAVFMTVMACVGLALSEDWWGLIVILCLCISRACNVIIIRRRTNVNWQGASEPGVRGDLLVLLSQDRWIRMRGLVDDLKAVTSGQWLRDMTFAESSISSFATVLVYLDVALASNVHQAGKLILVVLLIASAGILAIANETTQMLHMHGRVITVDDGGRTKYARRLDMVEQLVKESGRDDWALRTGMVISQTGEKNDKVAAQEGVTM